MTKVLKMLIKNNIPELVHSAIRSHSADLQEEVLVELYLLWDNLTADQQEDILSDMRWWTAIARLTPTQEVKNFLKWATN